MNNKESRRAQLVRVHKEIRAGGMGGQGVHEDIRAGVCVCRVGGWTREKLKSEKVSNTYNSEFGPGPGPGPVRPGQQVQSGPQQNSIKLDSMRPEPGCCILVPARELFLFQHGPIRYRHAVRTRHKMPHSSPLTSCRTHNITGVKDVAHDPIVWTEQTNQAPAPKNITHVQPAGSVVMLFWGPVCVKEEDSADGLGWMWSCWFLKTDLWVCQWLFQ